MFAPTADMAFRSLGPLSVLLTGVNQCGGRPGRFSMTPFHEPSSSALGVLVLLERLTTRKPPHLGTRETSASECVGSY